jgi:hypothetical protein
LKAGSGFFPQSISSQGNAEVGSNRGVAGLGLSSGNQALDMGANGRIQSGV